VGYSNTLYKIVCLPDNLKINLCSTEDISVNPDFNSSILLSRHSLKIFHRNIIILRPGFITLVETEHACFLNEVVVISHKYITIHFYVILFTFSLWSKKINIKSQIKIFSFPHSSYYQHGVTPSDSGICEITMHRVRPHFTKIKLKFMKPSYPSAV